jgi:hypothetical protein
MESSQESWNWIWKLPVAASVQFFVWQTCHYSISTKSVLAHRGVNVSPTCPFCQNEDETILHCLLSCSRSAAVWHRCGFLIPLSLCSVIDMNNIAKIIHKIALESPNPLSRADILAKMGANNSDHLVTFKEPLHCLTSALLGDALDVSFSRT